MSQRPAGRPPSARARAHPRGGPNSCCRLHIKLPGCGANVGLTSGGVLAEDAIRKQGETSIISVAASEHARTGQVSGEKDNRNHFMPLERIDALD